MEKPRRFAPEFRERAVRLLYEHGREYDSRWAAVRSIAEKMGCSAETLRSWIRQAERDGGRQSSLTSAEGKRLKHLERENRQLRRANEILRKPSAFLRCSTARPDAGVHRCRSPAYGAEPMVGVLPRSVDLLRAKAPMRDSTRRPARGCAAPRSMVRVDPFLVRS